MGRYGASELMLASGIAPGPGRHTFRPPRKPMYRSSCRQESSISLPPLPAQYDCSSARCASVVLARSVSTSIPKTSPQRRYPSASLAAQSSELGGSWLRA